MVAHEIAEQPTLESIYHFANGGALALAQERYDRYSARLTETCRSFGSDNSRIASAAFVYTAAVNYKVEVETLVKAIQHLEQARAYAKWFEYLDSAIQLVIESDRAVTLANIRLAETVANHFGETLD